MLNCLRNIERGFVNHTKVLTNWCSHFSQKLHPTTHFTGSFFICLIKLIVAPANLQTMNGLNWRLIDVLCKFYFPLCVCLFDNWLLIVWSIFSFVYKICVTVILTAHSHQCLQFVFVSFSLEFFLFVFHWIACLFIFSFKIGYYPPQTHYVLWTNMHFISIHQRCFFFWIVVCLFHHIYQRERNEKFRKRPKVTQKVCRAQLITTVLRISTI